MVFSRFLAAVSLGALLCGCPQLGLGWSRDEVARIPSPDGVLEAVIEETNGGATTSFGYDAYVVASGRRTGRASRVATFYGAWRSESAYGVNPVWVGEKQLELQYLVAQTAMLSAFEPIVAGRAVEVRLRVGISDPNARARSMLQEKQKAGHHQ